MKDDRIFGYESYEDFNKKYFKKELVAFEDFHKVRQLKYARVKYNNRMGRPFNQVGALANAGTNITRQDVGAINQVLQQQRLSQSRLMQQDTQ